MSQKASQTPGDPKPLSPQSRAEQRAVLLAWAQRFYIDKREGMYRDKGNPVHALTAFRWAQYLRLPIPDWVLKVIGDIARNPEAPLMPSDGGPGPVSQAQTDERDLHIILRVKSLMVGASKLPATKAILQTSKEQNLSFERTRAIYYGRFRAPGERP